MLVAPIAHLEAIDRSELNRLLVAWGGLRRPEPPHAPARPYRIGG